MSHEKSLEEQAVDACGQVAEISAWIDNAPCNLDRSPDEAFLLRAIKVYEETGELAKNIIGMTGQNPRKGVTSNLEEVLDEAADGVVTLLGLIEHLTDNQGESMPLVFAKIAKVHQRMQDFVEGPIKEQIADNEAIEAYLRRNQ